MTNPIIDIGDDDDDLFSEPSKPRSAGAGNPFEGMTPEEYNATAAHWEKPKRKSTTKRDNPEKRAQDRIWKHLVTVYGAIPRRVNSGQWRDEAGNMIMGAKAGTADILCCICIIVGESTRLGVYFAIETKSLTGKPTEAQTAFLTRIAAYGGIACVARTTLDIDNAIEAYVSQLSARLGVPVRAGRARNS